MLTPGCYLLQALSFGQGLVYLQPAETRVKRVNPI